MLSNRQQVRHLGEEEQDKPGIETQAMNTSTRWERVFQGFVIMFAFYNIIPAAVKKRAAT